MSGFCADRDDRNLAERRERALEEILWRLGRTPLGVFVPASERDERRYNHGGGGREAARSFHGVPAATNAAIIFHPSTMSPASKARAQVICWISSVPPPIWRSFASRASCSTWNSRM